jgi:ribosome maturation factor RimP
MGYDVLEVSLKGSGNSRVLTVRLERKDEVPISVEELERASRVLGGELDRLDLIESAYRLEVESPGPDRPLLTPRHFQRFAGLKAKVRSPEGNFTGRIEGVSEDTVTFLVGKELLRLKIGEFKANLAEWPQTPR